MKLWTEAMVYNLLNSKINSDFVQCVQEECSLVVRFGSTEITAARAFITVVRALNSDMEKFLLRGGTTYCVSNTVS